MAKKKSEQDKSFFEEKVESPKQGKLGKVYFFIASLIIFILVIAGILYSGILGSKNNKIDAKFLVGAVGKHVDLPAEEAPTIATVSDVEKLSGQPFFSLAKNGDKVLVYEKSRKAILYRPTTDKIINISIVGPVQGGAISQNTSTVSTPAISSIPKPVKTTILNGTKKVGFAKSIEDKLTAENIDIEATTANAQNEYENTTIVDLTGKNKARIDEIIKKIGGKSGSIPDGEVKPDGDILIILGSDSIE